MTDREQLEQAIAALEAQRAVLGDEAVATSIAALREKLAALRPASLDAQQRKQITVLFADVSGFTPMSETMDAEEVTDLMNAVWQRIDRAILAHGGIIDKHMGDAVMALWGADETREDDPERAIRAALDMQAELVVFREAHAASLQMRVGINTGPVLLGGVGTTGEFSAMGDAVNLTQRLQSEAPVGTLLISHDTYRHVRGVFDVTPQAPLTVKGKREPVRTYIVQRAKPRAFRMPTRGVEGIETRTVGRDAELLALQNAFRDTVDEAETRIVTVVGEAGVGKSRLLYEFENWIELLSGQIYYFKGRAKPETQTVPYGAIRDLFAYRFEILESDSAAMVMEKFRARMADVLKPEQADLVGHLVGFDFSLSQAVQNLLGSPSFKELATVYLIDYIRAMANEPTVMFLEDVHWADDSSLDLLDDLVTRIPHARLLVVCLARPLLFERRPNWGEGQEIHTRLDLKPLSRRASRELVDEILQKAAFIPDGLRTLVVEGAEGNPFYVEELIKMLIEDGVIVCGEEQWCVELDRLAQVRVPPTLTAVLQARLDSLPWEEKALLQRASVVGRLFWDATVSSLQAEGDRVLNISSGLEAVRARELVFRHERSAFAGVTEYLFKHAMLRDVTYETVLLKLRRVYHRQVAEWLEATGGERVGEFAGLIADHYERAGEAKKAAEWLRQSGEAAYQTSAYREAIAVFERALGLLADQYPAERAALLVSAGNAYIPLGQFAMARERLEAGLALAQAEGDLRTAAEALNDLGLADYEQGEFDKARNLSSEALELARSVGDRHQEGRALRSLGNSALYQGDYAEAVRCHEQSLALCAELGDRRGTANSLKSLGNVARDQGDLATAVRRYQDGLAIHRQMGDRRAISASLNNLANISTANGNYAAAVPLYEESLAISREISDLRGVYIALVNLGYVAQYQGDYPTSIQRCQESLAICRQLGDRFGIAACFDTMGFTALMAGDEAAARRYLCDGMAEAMEIGVFAIVLDTLAGLAQLRLRAGQPVQAAEWIGLALHHPSSTSDVARSAEAVLADLQAALPAEALEAALQRGQSLDIQQVVAGILAEPD
jgi:predicted ATPase/class 3 adenylate cyclase